jgi:hypothetical protein
VVPPVFKTGGRRAASSAGSIPVRLRHLRDRRIRRQGARSWTRRRAPHGGVGLPGGCSASRHARCWQSADNGWHGGGNGLPPAESPADGTAMSRALYWWRAAARRSWRQALLLAVIGGLLGSVALGAIAGARRTATAYGRLLTLSPRPSPRARGHLLPCGRSSAGPAAPAPQLAAGAIRASTSTFRIRVRILSGCPGCPSPAARRSCRSGTRSWRTCCAGSSTSRTARGMRG